MNLFPLFFGLLLVVAQQVKAFSFDDLDKARAAMLDMEKAVAKTTAAPTRRISRPVVHAMLARPMSIHPLSKVRHATVINYNKRNEAMYQVERAEIDASSLRRRPKESTVINYIKTALNSGNVMFARKALGLGFYVATKSYRGKRSVGTNPVLTFVREVVKKTGYDKVKKLLAVEGEATLMFAIDITGSMGGEINAAKGIVTAISDYAARHPVDFILSSFGDPIDQGALIYKGQGKVDEFKKEVGKLRANAGGDCAEYAFNGMINAFNADQEPSVDSPMYLFTDATPKDADEDNKVVLEDLAASYGTTINAFVWKDCRQGPYTFDDFKKLAENTGGQFLELKTKELGKITKSIMNTLGGSTTVGLGNDSGRVGKRSTTRYISIPVDETISNLIITITTTGSTSGNNIQLFTPAGGLWTNGKVTLTKVVIYELDFTMALPGLWKLEILAGAGEFTYTVKAQSKENVDFQYSYMKNIRGQMVPVKHPLTGEDAHLTFVISRKEKVVKSSLQIQIIDLSGRTLQTIKKVKQLTKSGLRFGVVFRPPSNKGFKIKLRGKTTGRHAFERISQFFDRAKSLLLKVYYTSKYFTIPRGGKTTMLLYLYNSSDKRRCCTVTVKDTLKYKFTIHRPQSNCVFPKRKKTVRITVQGTSAGKTGDIEKIFVIATTKDTPKVVTSELVSFMVV